MPRPPALPALLIAVLLAGFAFSYAQKQAANKNERWVGTWACSPQLVEPANRPPAPGLADNTLRQVIHSSVGGSRIRLRFSNAFGTSALTLASVHVALPADAGAIKPETDKPLTFNGRPSVTIPAGGLMISDPIAFALAPLSDLAVTLHAGVVPEGITGHPGSRATSFLAAGDDVATPSLPSPVTADHWYVLNGVDVVTNATRAAIAPAAIAIAGDSITDGRGSTTNGNNRWPDDLAARLVGEKTTANIAVLNHGIGGNRVLRDGLGPNLIARFDRDVIAQTGVRWVIVLEGVNDLGTAGKTPPAEGQLTTAEELIAAFQQMIVRAHAHGLRIYGATILPFGASSYFSPRNEANRQAVNTWIRTSGAFDAVIDFDKVTQDPAHPDQLLTEYNSGDHLHPSVAGYHAMANAIPLTLFARP